MEDVLPVLFQSQRVVARGWILRVQRASVEEGQATWMQKGEARVSATSGTQRDLVSALVNLGYKPAQAEKAAEGVCARGGEASGFEQLFREALKGLRAGT